MEVVGSEVHLWLSDEWIGVAFIEKIDIDTSMLRGDLTELRMVGARDIFIERSDKSRKYPRSTEIPTTEDDKSPVFRKALYQCFEFRSNDAQSMKPGHIVPSYLEEDRIVLGLFHLCHLRRNIRDDSSRDSPILDSCRTDQLRESASDALFWSICTDSYSGTISEDEK